MKARNSRRGCQRKNKKKWMSYFTQKELPSYGWHVDGLQAFLSKGEFRDSSVYLFLTVPLIHRATERLANARKLREQVNWEDELKKSAALRDTLKVFPFHLFHFFSAWSVLTLLCFSINAEVQQ